ncbi:hypothetical protein RRG08_062422 [Elysia crispata]|uniref:Uncharacterized protein n=1 Tax=Elysia crispata TaxID=231223 RepID=A0AAE0ZBJ1_9GAST|nr:hypothetical protein RRG08_062422 [Elysia crispata]
MKVVQVSLAICIIASYVCGQLQSDNTQSEYEKLQESLRRAKFYCESAAAQVDDSSRRELIAAIDKAFDLKEQWTIDLSAYNGYDANQPDYDDFIANLNQAFDGVKTQIKEDIKDLDDDAMRQKVKEELNSLIQDIDSVYTSLGISG